MTTTPVLLAMKIGALSLLGAGMAIAMYVIASTPSREASRLGVRGLKRQRVLAEGGLWRSVEPFVRWLSVRISRFVSDTQREKLDRDISLAGDFFGLTADELVALSVMSTVAGAITGAVVGLVTDLGALAVVFFMGGGAITPFMRVTATAQERQLAIGRGLPYVIDLMALAMGAGLDFPGAVRQVIEKSSSPNDPVVEEFTLILHTISIGRTRREALLEFARRSPNESVQEFTAALVQADERGNPVADTLQIQATSARQRRSARAEEAASKAGVAMSGPLVIVFLAIFGLILGPIFLGFQGF